jgi:serine/threonine-protein kinase
LLSRLPAEKRVAILPFGNTGNDPNGQAFCDGLLESAVASLRQLEPSLVVIPAADIRRLAVTTADQARKLAGTNLVISGTVQRTGKSVQIDLKLMDPRTPRLLDQAQVVYDSGQSGSIQERLGAALVKLLGLKVPERKRDPASRVPAANEAYLEGSGYLQRFDIPGNLDKGIAALQRATAQDPDFAAAYIALSGAYQRRFRETKDRQFLDLARDNAAKALDLNGSSADARVASGVVLSLGGDQEGAITEFRRAISIDPLNTDALRELAAAYDSAGRTADAEATYRKAVELRPNDWITLADLGVFHNNHQQYAEAEKDFLSVVALVPDSPAQHRNLGGVYIKMGRFPDAERELLKSIGLGPTSSAYTNLAALYLYLGRYRDAIGPAHEAIRLAPATYRSAFTLWGNLADAYRYTPDQAAKAPAAYQRAIQEAERQLAFEPDNPALLANVAVYSAKMGDRGRALDAIGRAMRFAHGNSKISFQAAIVYELTGARDRALAALGDATRGGYSPDEIAREPELAKLRQDPKYKSILAAQHSSR